MSIKIYGMVLERAMDKMVAWVLTAPKNLVYMLVDMPLCGENQVLVKLDTACICNGSDPGMYNGHEAYMPPYVFGHEPSGEIIGKGKNVVEFEVGERVTWWFTVGAFAQYAAVTPSDVCMLKLPSTITRECAPVFELVFASARAIRNENITKNTKLLILGLGPSGLVMCQRAKALGAKTVVGWDLYELRRRTARAVGCDYAFNPAEAAFECTKAISSEFDLVIDAMGDDILEAEDTLIQATKLIKKGGKIISYGHPTKGRRFMPFDFQSRNIIMQAPENNLEHIRIIAKETLDFVVQGKIKIEPLITDIFPLYEADKALFKAMEHPDKCIKIIIDCKKYLK